MCERDLDDFFFTFHTSRHSEPNCSSLINLNSCQGKLYKLFYCEETRSERSTNVLVFFFSCLLQTVVNT